MWIRMLRMHVIELYIFHFTFFYKVLRLIFLKFYVFRNSHRLEYNICLIFLQIIR